jgi:cholera toxin transcriptional activator
MEAHPRQVCFSQRNPLCLNGLPRTFAHAGDRRFGAHRLNSSSAMTGSGPARRYRFGVFEADASTGELRRQGVRVRLNAQPFQVLLLLLGRPGQLLTRDEISRQLWPDGTFVDEDHGVHSAINRIREALGDTAAAPRFVETLARRGYRFVAPVEAIGADSGERLNGSPPVPPADSIAPVASSAPVASPGDEASAATGTPPIRFLASPDQLPKLSWQVTQTFFLLFQLMYLGFYVGALANLGEIQDLLSPLRRAATVFFVIIITAALLIAVRAFVLTAALLRAPGFRGKFLRLWLFLLPCDELWALSPFLLLHHISFGLALASTALLAGSPFAQRSLVLMGAAEAPPQASAAAR